MCGISGIIFKEHCTDFTQARLELEKMRSSQHLRGPDSSGEFNDTKVFLAHNRLSILDLSPAGNQPMQNEDWVIVFNGEIYNYVELRDELIGLNETFIGSSDTEVLLTCISRFGIQEAIQKINGIFSFCAYNKYTKEVHLVRDRLGEKPLFYYLDEDSTLYFSSNPSAIVNSLPQVDWHLDYEGLWEYFVLGGIFSDKTLFKGINRLDSASVLSYVNNEITISKYWTPTFKPNLTDSDLDEIIREAIRSRTVSDVPIVLFLSGGVDSSAVAAVLKDIDAVHLISDELDSARKVAEKFKMRFEVVRPESLDISETLFKYSEFSGEATMAGFIPYVTSKAISGEYKVAISANGADELFFGYLRIPTPKIKNEFFDKLSKRRNININRRSSQPDGQIAEIFRHPDNFSIPLSGKVRSMTDLLGLIELELKDFNQSGDFPESSKYRWLELMTYVKGDLNNTLDFASMANSLEVRAPFLDYRLVEAALSLDETRHINIKNGRKHFLKKILDSEGVDESIWNRDKLGFSLISSYFNSIESIKDSAVAELSQEGFLSISCTKGSFGRDLQYLRSAALGFLAWKKAWIDSGKVKK